MAFNAPSLNQVAAADTDYRTKINNNTTSIEDAFNSIETTFAASQDGTAEQISTDHYRRTAGSDPIGGVIGTLSCVFDGSVADVVTLKASNLDLSSNAVMSGTRRSKIGDISIDLTALGLANVNDQTIFVGLNTLSSASFDGVAASLASGMALALYEVVVDVAAGVYTVTKVKRVPRTLIWDNTVQQEMLERPQTLTYSISAMAASEDFLFPLPFDCSIKKMSWFNKTAYVATLSAIEIKDSAGATSYLTITQANPVANTVYSANVLAIWDGVVFAEGTVLEISRSAEGVSSDAIFTIELLPAYNMPTQ